MKIQVPQWAQGEFWDEPPAGSIEFWGFRFKPRCREGDTIEYYFGHDLVATAAVYAIEPPERSKCGHSGRFGTLWKVFWLPETFKDLREAQ